MAVNGGSGADQERVLLEKIDILRERAEISYEDARRLLQETGGDVVEALVRVEKAQASSPTEKIFTRGGELIDRVKELIHQGNVRKIRVRTGNDVLLEIPITAGAVAAVMAPTLAIVGTVAALATNCSIEVDRLSPTGRAEAAEVLHPETPLQ
ncbi:MAG: DUF4342 domain-containing protein [Firmicutes bacterium]|nr:DUF4342 domain-containing protein [Bacillota bacterium]